MRLTETVTPLKPLEAMAQGRLLIASDVGGHRELIEDGVTGYLFEPGDPEELAAAVREGAADRDRWDRSGRMVVAMSRRRGPGARASDGIPWCTSRPGPRSRLADDGAARAARRAVAASVRAAWPTRRGSSRGCCREGMSP